jgi:hypothetical protein
MAAPTAASSPTMPRYIPPLTHASVSTNDDTANLCSNGREIRATIVATCPADRLIMPAPVTQRGRESCSGSGLNAYSDGTADYCANT